MKVINWLNKPYPLIQNTRSKLLLVLSFAVFVYVFLLIFQPFGAAQQVAEGRSYYLIGFGLTVGVALSINYLF